MKRFFLSCLLIFLFTGRLAAEEEDPLFAGTLLSFYALNAEPGRLAVQPFLFLTRQSGEYDPQGKLLHNRNVHLQQLLLSLETGITDTIDVNFLLNAEHAHASGGDIVRFGDTQIFFGFQTSKGKKDTIVPDSRLLVGFGFPTGKFENLKANGNAFDGTGVGAYQMFVGFALRKIFFNIKDHPYNTTLNFFYVPSSNVFVRGLNFFGGTELTRGTIKPGDQFICNVAFEYDFTKNWGCGIDIHYVTQARTLFDSEVAEDPFIETPSSEILSLAPCLEYNFNKDFSITWGAWFTVKGRNAFAFSSLAATLYYYF